MEYNRADIERIKASVINQINGWKVLIVKFSEFSSKNLEEIQRLIKRDDQRSKEKVDILYALNKTLEEAIAECFELIYHNEQKLANFDGSDPNSSFDEIAQ